MKIAQRAAGISPSATLSIDTKAKQMQADGIDIIGFGVGEPDFDTPDNIKQAAIRAIEQGRNKYTPVAGIVELKKAICEKLRRENNLVYQPAQIVASCGAKHSLYNVLQVLVELGDEVLLPAPYWVSYEEQIKLAGGKAVVIVTDERTNFKVTVQQLEQAVTANTRGLILNSPSNPTGSVYTSVELEAIAQFVVKHDLFVLSDEIYEKLIYDDAKVVSIASFGEEIKKRTIVINGLSKAYAMPGWRLGYMAAEPEIINAVVNLQGHSTSNPTSIVQYAAIEALTGPQQAVEDMRLEFKRRRDCIVDLLNHMQGITCNTPQGAFYVFPNVRAIFGKIHKGRVISDVNVLAELLLNEAHIAIVPGTAFGAPDNIRISYATSMEKIQEGMRRMETFIAGLADRE